MTMAAVVSTSGKYDRQPPALASSAERMHPIQGDDVKERAGSAISRTNAVVIDLDLSRRRRRVHCILDVPSDLRGEVMAIPMVHLSSII